MTTNNDALQREREAFNAFLLEQHELHKDQHNHFHVARNEWARRSQATQSSALAASKPEPQDAEIKFGQPGEFTTSGRWPAVEPQAQAGETEVVWIDSRFIDEVREHGGAMFVDISATKESEAQQGFITLQAHREAMAEQHEIERQLSGLLEATSKACEEKDAALKAQTEALEESRAFIGLIKGAALQSSGFFNQGRRDQMFKECVRLSALADAAIKQVQEAQR